jgi:hypothetical protein
MTEGATAEIAAELDRLGVSNSARRNFGAPFIEHFAMVCVKRH